MTHWILLRGLTRQSLHWGAFTGQLAPAMQPAEVLALDLPGNGSRWQHRSPCSVHAMMQDCRQQLQRLSIAPPYRLLAMSLGAMVSVAWAQAHPHEVAAQVLINPSMRPLNPFYQRLRPAHYACLLGLMLRQAEPAAWERHILRITSQRGDASVLPLWVSLRRQHPVSGVNALRQLCAAARFAADLQAPPVPSLLLAGARDALVAPQCSSAWAQAWGCALQIHPWAGHDLALDDPAWLIEQARQRLQGVAAI